MALGIIWYVVLALYIVFGLSIMFLCGFIEPDENGGFLAKLAFGATVTLPKKCSELVMRFFGQRVHDFLYSIYDYFMYKPNPMLQIFYLSLVIGGYGVFVINVYPEFPNAYAGAWHKYTAALTIAACLTTFSLAVSVSPGVLDKDTYKQFDNYDFDELMYYSGKTCSTCNIPKLARSKHDRITGRCVARFDHFCGWLNQCVGERNHRFFLLFLFTHACMLTYGDFLLGSVLASQIYGQRLFEQQFVNASTGARVKASYTIVIQYLMHHKMPVMSLFILAFVMTFVIWGFLFYHLMLVSYGVTTNESFKWKSITSYYKRLMKMHAKGTAELAKAKASGDEAEIERIMKAYDPELLKMEKKDLICPKNIYNRGFIKNFMEVIFPRCEQPFAGANPRTTITAMMETLQQKEARAKVEVETEKGAEEGEEMEVEPEEKKQPTRTQKGKGKGKKKIRKAD